MPQVKVTLEGKAIEFIDNHKKYGYSSRTELVRDAISFAGRLRLIALLQEVRSQK